MSTPYRKIGTVVRASGLKGQVIIFHKLLPEKPLSVLEHIFIELVQGSYIPFFPELVPEVMDAERTIWKLEEVDSIEEAKALIGKDVYVETTVFEDNFSKPSFSEEELAGFQILDKTSGHSAIIEFVTATPGHLLAHVLYQGKTVLLPLAEDFIVNINPEERTIEMSLPDGIWDIQ